MIDEHSDIIGTVVVNSSIFSFYFDLKVSRIPGLLESTALGPYKMYLYKVCRLPVLPSTHMVISIIYVDIIPSYDICQCEVIIINRLHLYNGQCGLITW